MNPRQLLEQIRRRPLLFVGGLVGLFAIANLGDLFNRGGSTAPTDAPPADPNADPATATSAAADPVSSDPYGFSSPGYGVPSYNPFTTDMGTTQPTTQYTADGCPLPRPETPAIYAGQGEYVCDSATRSWIWQWNAAKTTAGGCLLPKPKVPPQYTGQGDWTCDAGTKAWVWKWKDRNPPAAGKPGRLVLGAGKHQTFKVDPITKKGSDPRQWQHAAVTVQTGPRVHVSLANGSAADLVKITSGGQAGRWIRPGAGTWTAPTKG